MARGIFTRGRWSQIMKMWADDGDDEQTSVIVDESTRLNEAPASPAPTGGTGGGGVKRDPKMTIIKRIGLAFTGGGSDFEDPEFTFDDITNAYNAEAYVRQALDKYVELMFKAGYDFVGKNPNAVEYIKMRFALMAESTQIPTMQLLVEMAEDIVKFSNVVLVKARAQDANIFAGLNVQGLSGMQPVAGYFPLNMGTLKVKRDQYGTIKQWQQEAGSGGSTKNYKADDIVHIYYKREKGRAFGTPFLVSAMDDIRALRQVEESVLRLVYRNLHPLWHIKVGLPDEGQGADSEEVEKVQAQVENMDVEGGLITTERVNVSAISSNQIIDAKEYLKHFEQRAFTGLGVSELMMGRGNTANRSTGDNLSGEFTDRVKAFQRILETFINDMMIKEILMEGGFDPVLVPDDAVNFTFKEIDFDSLIKKENQAVFLYEHNAISEDEMRTLLGRDPVEDGDVRSKMHLQLVTIATLEAEAALAPTPAGTTGGGAASKSQTKKKAATDNKTKPANQSGVKSSPKKATNKNQQFAMLLKDMYNEYSLLNEAVNKLVIKHYKEGGDNHLRTIGGAVAYAENQCMEILRDTVGEEATDVVRVPVKRMFLNIRDQLAEAFDMRGSEALSHTAEITQIVFDLFRDRLQAIVTKAFDTHANQEKEVEGDG